MIFHSITFARRKVLRDRYYCINSTKHYKNEENILALYFITTSHLPTGVRFQKYDNCVCMIRAEVKYS